MRLVADVVAVGELQREGSQMNKLAGYTQEVVENFWCSGVIVVEKIAAVSEQSKKRVLQ